MIGRTSFHLGSLDVMPGEKGSGTLEVTRAPDGQVIGIPVLLVNGTKKGPALSIVCGVHGDEYEARIAVADILRSLDVSNLAGTVIWFPVANVDAFTAASRIGPIDSVNLNAAFPGDPKGTLTRRVAFTMLECILESADYLLDLHSGGNIYTIVPYTVCHTEGEHGRKSLALSKAFGASIILQTSSREGWVSGTLYAEATARGVPSIIAEAGGEGRLRSGDIEIHERGILNVMKHLGMVAGSHDAPGEFLLLRRPSDGLPDTVTADASGVLRLLIEPGAVVSKGDMLGEIIDACGVVRGEVASPRDGIVIDLRTAPLVREGDPVALIAEIREGAPR